MATKTRRRNSSSRGGRAGRASRPEAIAAVPPLYATPVKPKGSLLIIGGRENKDGHRVILEDLARRANGGAVIVATMATEEPEEQFEEYRKVFTDLGVKHVRQLDVRRREELLQDPRLELMENAKVVFFAGGDQLKITSRFGGTPLCDAVRHLYETGGTIAGTSSGASAMSETMMVSGSGDESPEGTDTIRMAPGLAFIPSVIIDQHFAERGRMGRLLAAVAQNPRLIGLGIDENTAVRFDGDRLISVLGDGAVYVVDGRAMTYTSATESDGRAASIYGMVVHVLSDEDVFDLQEREPRSQTKRNGSSAKSNRRS